MKQRWDWKSHDERLWDAGYTQEEAASECREMDKVAEYKTGSQAKHYAESAQVYQVRKLRLKEVKYYAKLPTASEGTDLGFKSMGLSSSLFCIS